MRPIRKTTRRGGVTRRLPLSKSPGIDMDDMIGLKRRDVRQALRAMMECAP